jgi:RNA recognition motif-containing protein
MKIFIANFPFHLTETDICDLFKLFGEIVDCKLVTDPETGKSRGFGFIEFRNRKQAWTAMKKMNNLEIGGRYVAVTASTSEKAKKDIARQTRLKHTG